MMQPAMVPRTEPFPRLGHRQFSFESSSTPFSFSSVDAQSTHSSSSPGSKTPSVSVSVSVKIQPPLKSILKKRPENSDLKRTFKEHAHDAGLADVTNSFNQISLGEKAPTEASTSNQRRGRSRAGSNVSSILSRVFKRRDSSTQDNGRSKRIKLDHLPDAKIKQAKKKARDLREILKADPAKRRQYEARHKLAFEEKLEKHRREHPEERPDFQKRYLVEKQKKLFPGTAYDCLQGPRDFQVVVEEYQAERRQEEALHADFQRRYTDSVMDGSPLLTTPAIGVLPSLHLDMEERLKARIDGCFEGKVPEDPGLQQYKGFSTGRKAAMGLSKMLDPFRRRGEMIFDGDMDFGMTDSAPAGTMESCVSCGLVTRSFLVHGMCEGCVEQQSTNFF